MRGGSARKTTALFVLLALLTAGSGAGAQNPPRREEISEELAALVRNRGGTITFEASNLPDDEWAGTYRAFGGPTITTHLAWSPASGFMVWWENCSRPHLARVNYGKAVFTNGSLKLTPELSENGPSAYPVESEFIPVKWGEQHFLIPSDKMINFAYAVNSKSVEQVESFLMKVEDYGRDRKGLPDVPRAYRRHLGMKPITATVSGFEPRGDRWHPNVILNAGRAKGVVPEMMFYLSRPGDIYMKVMVTDVEEHRSKAFVMIATFTDNREEDVNPKVGWKFTSRAPEDDSRYGP
jgi:hypothetical protein